MLIIRYITLFNVQIFTKNQHFKLYKVLIIRYLYAIYTHYK